jgi:hypothetical protein
MRALTIAGFLIFLTVSGCGLMKSRSTNPTSAPEPSAVPTDTQPQPLPAESQNQPDASNAPGTSSDAAHPAVPPPAGPAPTPLAAKPKPSSETRPTRPPVTVVTPPAPATPVAPTAPSPQPDKAPATATLDLGQLESRLRDTRAIGVFTKLTLKNQVDDLLSEFRIYYRGPNKRPSAAMRQHYDSLLAKVLGLLRDGDPPLAAAISSSREAIWGILSDPDKFARL